MSELIIVEKQDITAIADSIREKSGTEDQMTLAEMAEAVLNMSAGSEDIPFYENISYTGNASYIDDGDGNYRVKFLSSGTLTVQEGILVDVFVVGGGGSGGRGSSYAKTIVPGGGGGGGGYTKTAKNIKLLANTEYTVVIGAACGASSLVDLNGLVICEAAGGQNGEDAHMYGNYAGKGGSGGSGGAEGIYTTESPALPGSDGNNATGSKGGTGQGTTTREFGEPNGDLYAGGGGAGGATTDYAGRDGSAGGAGGGGDGGLTTRVAGNGGENTGGGGGGGRGTYDTNQATYLVGGTGGSGIVIIRNFRLQTA